MRKYIPFCAAGGFMHNGWQKICRSFCRKMDVFGKKKKKRRWLCNLITSVASVADRVTRCSHSASITWLNFGTLAADTRAEEGRSPLGAGRGLPLAGRLQHRRDAAGLARDGELGGSRPLPTRGLPKSSRKGRAGCLLPGKVTGTPGLRCEAAAERGRKAAET